MLSAAPEFSYYKVASFCGLQAEGNLHAVYFFSADTKVDNSLFTRLSEASAPLISVFLMPSCEASYDFRARYFQQAPAGASNQYRAREIYRCGSGSLAAAKVLSQVSDKPVFRLRTQAGLAQVGRSRSEFFYQTARLAIENAENVRVWQQLIDRKIIKVAFVGSANQYCILELSSELDVARVRVNAAALCRVSRRALIITAKSNQLANDYVMRYLSPQYSVGEDAATGSANAVLAAYWQRALNKHLIRGRQLSKPGGVFTVKKVGVAQRVYGHCQIIETRS